MCQKLPTHGFKFLENPEKWTAKKIMKLKTNTNIGYMFQCTLKYPSGE